MVANVILRLIRGQELVCLHVKLILSDRPSRHIKHIYEILLGHLKVPLFRIKYGATQLYIISSVHAHILLLLFPFLAFRLGHILSDVKIRCILMNTIELLVESRINWLIRRTVNEAIFQIRTSSHF